MNYERILEYSEKEELKGRLEGFQGKGAVTEPECNDEMVICIRTHREIITEIRYTITETACPPVKACAAAVAEMARNIPVLEAYLIDAKKISDFFDCLDMENYHCAQMAELALKKAIVDYVSKRPKA